MDADRALPARGELPVARERERHVVGVRVVDDVSLHGALGEPVFLKRIGDDGNLVGEVDELLVRGDLGRGREAVAAAVDPWLLPAELGARARVGGVAETDFEDASLPVRD